MNVFRVLCRFVYSLLSLFYGNYKLQVYSLIIAYSVLFSKWFQRASWYDVCDPAMVFMHEYIKNP